MLEWSLILSFATWRVTSLLFVESPFEWLRSLLRIEDDEATGARTVPDNIIGALFDCFRCLSLVVSLCFAVAVYVLTDFNVFEALVIWLASAAGALVLDVRYFARLRGR